MYIHAFCLKCITKWAGNKLPQDSVDCPLCRKQFKIPDKGVGDLPKNIFIGKLLSVKEMSSTRIKAMLCDWCKNDPIIPNESKAVRMFCVDCRQNLCERCKDLHSNIPAIRVGTTFYQATAASHGSPLTRSSRIRCTPNAQG